MKFGFPDGKISLAILTLEDAEEFLDLAKRSLADLEPWMQPPLSFEAFRDLHARSQMADFKALTVRESASNALLGMVQLSQIFGGAFQSAYLSYWVGAGHGGRGRMQEALRLTLHYAFEGLGLHRLEANIQPGNARSIALVSRLGFVKEGFSVKYLKVLGEWKDHERWAIHREIWPEDGLENAGRPVWSAW